MFQTVAASFTAERQDSQLKDDGDVETALQGAGVLEAEYKVPYLAHAPLEPMNAVVQLKDGRLDIWTGTQIPLFVVDGGVDNSLDLLSGEFSEPALDRFAHVKTHHGFERMRLRGLFGARNEFHLAAIVQNLKTIALRLLGPPTGQMRASIA
jgi:hypothetical protein